MQVLNPEEMKEIHPGDLPGIERGKRRREKLGAEIRASRSCFEFRAGFAPLGPRLVSGLK
jgi:hypothetical protein